MAENSKIEWCDHTCYECGVETSAYVNKYGMARDWNRRVQPAVPDLLEALKWYEERARLCRSFGNAGESARNGLDKDGGQRARAAIAKATGGEG